MIATASQRSLWPFLLMPVAVAVFALADLAQFHQPFIVQNFLLLIAPVLWLGLVQRTAIADGWLQRWLLLAMLLLAYMALNHLVQPALPTVAWWRLVDRCAAFSALIVVALSGAAPGDLIRALGAGSAVCVSTVVVITGLFAWTGMGDPDFFYGLGQVSILGNCCGPAMIAWLVWFLVGKPRDRRAIDGVLIGLGCASLAVVAAAGSRRGMVVAWAAIILFLAVEWLWRRSRRAAIAVSATLVIAAIAVVAALLLHPDLATTDMRVLTYRGAFELAGSSPWLGRGHHAAMAMQWHDGENCRHVTALGPWLMQAHNEFLDALIDGGGVGFALAVTLAASLAWRTCRIRDRAHRLPCQVLGVAILVHALTDNCYATLVGQVWCASALGVILAMPASTPPWRIWKPLSSPRLLLWPMALIAATASAVVSGHAFVGRNASAAVHRRAFERAIEPQVFVSHARAVLSEAVIGQAPRPPEAFYALIRRRLGTDGAFVQFRLALSDQETDARSFVVALTTAIPRYPFFSMFYRDLDQVLERHPELTPLVAERLRARVALLRGSDPWPTGGPTPATDIETAADRFVLLARAIDQGRAWPELVGPLRDLVARYGDCNGVAEMALLATTRAEDGSMAWLLNHHRALRRGCDFSSNLLRFLHSIDSADQSRRLLPLLRRIYPTWVDDGERDHVRLDPFEDGHSQAIHIQVMRIAAVAGAAERRQPAAKP